MRALVAFGLFVVCAAGAVEYRALHIGRGGMIALIVGAALAFLVGADRRGF